MYTTSSPVSRKNLGIIKMHPKGIDGICMLCMYEVLDILWFRIHIY